MSKIRLKQIMIASALTSTCVASSAQAEASAPEPVWQLQLDLFDFSSPGYGFWLDRVVLWGNEPRWQAYVAGGMFNHYDPGELKARGWGHARDQRRFVRVGASWFVWRGLFVGMQSELMQRRITFRGTGEQLSTLTPTLQPALGYNAQPWGYNQGRYGLMVWIAPRVPLVREELSSIDGVTIPAMERVEFASGLNLTLSL